MLTNRKGNHMKYESETVIDRCTCDANQNGGTCLLPIRAQLRDRQSGGWWCGRGQTEEEAIADAKKYAANHHAFV